MEQENLQDEILESTEVQTKKSKKRKKWQENECPKYLWVIALILSYVVGSIPLGIVMFAIEPVFEKIFPQEKAIISFIFTILAFGCLLLFFIIFIKSMCKTTTLSFILGRERKIDKKPMWHMALLYALGFVISYVISLPNITLNPDATFVTIVKMILVAVLFTWIQTSLEELWFRGIIGRIFFGDSLKQRFSVKVVIYVLLSSVLFMLPHLVNPEVTSQVGIDVIFSALTYLCSGVILAVVDVYYGNLVPGMVIHYVNNVLCFFLIGTEVAVIETPTIFIDHTSTHLGIVSFVQEIIMSAPIVIYLIMQKKKNKI